MARLVRATETAPTTYAWEIHTKDLHVRAGRRMAVNGLDLSLALGVHGILGPNGAGKTTLIRSLATVLQPAKGSLELLGLRPAGRDLRVLRREIGYLPQQFGFYPRFTVREFVEYMAWLKEIPKAAIPGAVQRAIDRTDLSGRADDKMKTLSGGMLRRAGIAQAIVNDPRILLLDEPTVGLDPAQRMQFRDLLRSLTTDTCVVVSTHLVEDVATACTDVLLMDEGRVVFQGTPAELAATGDASDAGDSPTERGYSAVLGRAR
jgi:ABC-type multidrug transport system ATPase subunit